MLQRVYAQNWYQKPSLHPDALGVVRFARLDAAFPVCGMAGTAIAPTAIVAAAAATIAVVNDTIAQYCKIS